MKIERYEVGPRGRTFPNVIIECRQWLVGETGMGYDFIIEGDSKSYKGGGSSWESLLPNALEKLKSVAGFRDVEEFDCVKI